ncbi:MAG: DUF1971 domain-containing protein [Hyphomicrobium sp.]|nr:DUF1971 domain-containing protein [Hyphomicrobium sp.]
MTSASITASLPPGLEHYKTSPEFTSTTVPQSLLSAHRTKAGVWGLLRVAQGRLRYCIDAAPPQALVIEQSGTAVIDPEALHHVELLDAETRFLIEFHRRAGAP